MTEPRSHTETIAGALQEIGTTWSTEEGLLEACAIEAALRLRELRGLLLEAWPHITSHTVPSADLLQRLVQELPEVRQ